ncbi:hypothetical protein C2E23DRAFT_736240 [Lenzites betulinus]|nr:hypothetical protein C2E23DRAFT_736240 [Lenzites betulinus]
MRERSKATEDISYFLVGKIERSKERAKAVNQILPTYPCLQPSDTTAFRIALAKYIEAIRNSIVHTTHAGEKPVEQKAKQPTSSARDDIPAWWWKDIVVRKSILEECCGERFERLILALSSHAILRNTSRAASILHPLSVQGHAVCAPNELSSPHLRLLTHYCAFFRSRLRCPRHTLPSSRSHRTSGSSGSDRQHCSRRGRPTSLSFVCVLSSCLLRP